MTDTLTPQARSIVTAIPGPKSEALRARKEAAVSDGVGLTFPIFIESAHDALLTDVDGNRFIDLGCGIGVTTIGHTNEAVVAAVQEQVALLTHTLFACTPYEVYVQVAEHLQQLTPGDHDKRTLLVNSGSEAVENGVKIARRATGRRAVAVLEHGYHGRTNLTMTMNFKPAPYATGMGPLASDIFHVPGSYPLRDGRTGAEAAKHSIWYLERHVGIDDLACLVVEPIQGEGGFIVPADGYLAAMQEWCTKHGVVMIADEVQSGVARTGKVFASEHFDWVPDLVLSAKGIAGGMPLAAVTGRAEIMNAVHAGGLGGTFGGNPVACAAALAVFSELESKGAVARAAAIEQVIRPLLEGIQERHPVIAEIRGRGAMIAMEFLDENKEPLAIAKAVSDAALQRGVVALTAGTDYNVIRLLPSVAITDAQLEEAIGVLEEAIVDAGY
ncbi:aminotransferase class III-fold pyridoxal phosphate-dependent enzyme [Humidisolicoccus flavus]|uniref:aminotransferase class III-fold pyridoxal phosphate-dependent enzyme n=1 Tax=Humidisolicoccus flavus TaxID=3111414 RepID=UPI00324F66EB